MSAVLTDDAWTLTARWIIPVTGPPLERGTVTVAGARIVAVEPCGARTADRDLGNVAILPGFVNAHTHLDLTGLRGQLPPGSDFTAWLRGVIAYRRGLTPEQVEANIRAGLAESVRCGTTLLGDIAGMGLSWPILAAAPIRTVVFYEMLGLPWSRVPPAHAAARDWLKAHPATATCRPGVSPHAPYSVHDALYSIAEDLAAEYGIPLATHLAESAAELDLLHHRTGPFVAFLTELGVWEPEGLIPRPSWLLRLCGRAPRVLFIHGNELGPTTRIPANGTVVYCPRTHAAFSQPTHPFRDFLKLGVRVALGTDSLASNPDLDLLAEARFLYRSYPELDGQALLRMATLSGAEALGWADETGSLEPGKSADLVAVPLPNEEAAEPYSLVLGPAAPVSAVLARGQWV